MAELEAERELTLRLAQTDSLTGLVNRGAFTAELCERLEAARAEGRRVALFVVDLDRFKHLNDTLGHHAGDLFLAEVGERLRADAGPSELVARLGGDEFAVLLVRTGLETAAEVAAKLVDSLSAPYSIPPHTLEISASIGVAAYPDSGADAEQLLKRADEAMYKVKFAGKRGHAVA